MPSCRFKAVGHLVCGEAFFILCGNINTWSIIFPKVEFMKETVTIDKNGRLIVPVRFREAIGMKHGGRASICLDGARLVIEPVSIDVKRKAEEWSNKARRNKVEAFSGENEESWKWMSRKYARRKLGLP
jgi:bifunctional DNA-binding transcriptional regulator/antitoxin component of YhaV-PrlF toxin-antitoxin module